MMQFSAKLNNKRIPSRMRSKQFARFLMWVEFKRPFFVRFRFSIAQHIIVEKWFVYGVSFNLKFFNFLYHTWRDLIKNVAPCV